MLWVQCSSVRVISKAESLNEGELMTLGIFHAMSTARGAITKGTENMRAILDGNNGPVEGKQDMMEEVGKIAGM